MNPQSYQTYFSLGFCHHLNGNINKGISNYHKALKFKPDSQFMQDMLTKALSDGS